jgi:uncharacterized membrane protein YphA (DoxX/SURF4 family)
MFWLLNGLDKFLNRQPFWYGDHRDLKFITYFASIHLPAPVALTVLHSMGVIETLLGIGFLTALLSRKIPLVFSQIYFKASILIFLLYSIGDIIFGDRAELLEHGTYLALIMIVSPFSSGRGQMKALKVTRLEQGDVLQFKSRGTAASLEPYFLLAALVYRQPMISGLVTNNESDLPTQTHASVFTVPYFPCADESLTLRSRVSQKSS